MDVADTSFASFKVSSFLNFLLDWVPWSGWVSLGSIAAFTWFGSSSRNFFNGNRLLHIKANLKRKLVTFLSICLMVSENCFLISRESKEFSRLPWVHDNPCKLTFYLFSWFLGSQLAESEEEKLFDEVQVSLRIKCEGISPFCFPSYKSPDTKDDMVCFSKNFSSCHSWISVCFLVAFLLLINIHSQTQ